MTSDKEENTSKNNAVNADMSDEALRSLSIVLGETANDFNNILSLIFGYVEMALSDIPEGARARSDLEHVLAAGDRAKELIARMLTFSNSNKLKQSNITIEKPVAKAISAFQEKLSENTTLNHYIENRNSEVFANYTEIYQMITNLLSNSLQAIGSQKGVITVNLEILEQVNNDEAESTNTGNVVKITISDDGCGMDLDTMQKIFKPFFTLSSDRDSETRRAGLGLTTVYNIVTQMNGNISVKSQPNEGSLFTITLPLLEGSNNYSVNDQDKPRISKKKSLLFIDDEETITSMARQMLEKNNYQINTYNDPNQAIMHFRENADAYDVVITDLIMPDITGTEVARRLNNINPDVPIILTTGYSENITSSSCQKLGISLVLNKPFVIRDLVSAIESVS